MLNNEGERREGERAWRLKGEDKLACKDDASRARAVAAARPLRPPPLPSLPRSLIIFPHCSSDPLERIAERRRSLLSCRLRLVAKFGGRSTKRSSPPPPKSEWAISDRNQRRGGVGSFVHAVVDRSADNLAADLLPLLIRSGRSRCPCRLIYVRCSQHLESLLAPSRFPVEPRKFVQLGLRRRYCANSWLRRRRRRRQQLVYHIIKRCISSSKYRSRHSAAA